MKTYRGRRGALLGAFWSIGLLPFAAAHGDQVVVSPTSGLTTSEDGSGASFTVVLDSAPVAAVTMEVISSDPGEGEALPARLTFSPEDWNQPRTVTVTGVADSLGDGDQLYLVLVRTTASDDPNFDGLDPDDVRVTNLDTTPRFVVSAISGVTTEGGGTASFTVALGFQPSAAVTLPLSSSNEAEGVVFPTQLTFTPDDWSSPKTVTVTGVADGEQDGDQSYTIGLGVAASDDPDFAGLDPQDVAVVNADTTRLRVVSSTISGATTEAGGEATFTVVLTAPPTASVAIPLSSSDPAEGEPAIDSLIFTPSDWDVPQTVTVVGVADSVVDGDQGYFIRLGVVISDDPDYDGIDPNDVAVVNSERASSPVIVSSVDGSTDEGGARATFTVALSRAPSADVVLTVNSSDPGEGTVSPSRLTFTPVNWESPQTVTVTGALDLAEDGDQAYVIEFQVSSADAGFDGLALPGLAVINHDRTVLADRVVGGEERLEGVLLRGTILNHGTLADVRVLGGGVVDGGTLSGTVVNSGTVRNVTLAAGSRVEGGTIGGTVNGEQLFGVDAPVVDGEVEAGAVLSNVTIGEGAELSPRATLGRGVRFAANEMIPEGLDVAALLEPLGGDGLYPEPVADLSGDVVVRGASGADPIIHGINSLSGIADAGLLVTQDGESGFLSLDVGNGFLLFRPVAVTQAAADTPAGFSIDGLGRFVAVTDDGRRVTLEAVSADPARLAEASAARWPNPLEVEEGGTLRVPIDDGRRWMMRPALLVTPSTRDLPEGIHEVAHPLAPGSSVLVHLFVDGDGRRWEQLLYPVAAATGLAETIAALPGVAGVVIDDQGVVRVQVAEGAALRGLLGLEVTAGAPGESGAIEFQVAGDLDGDGIDDLTVVAANGDRQTLRILP